MQRCGLGKQLHLYCLPLWDVKKGRLLQNGNGSGQKRAGGVLWRGQGGVVYGGGKGARGAQEFEVCV